MSIDLVLCTLERDGVDRPARVEGDDVVLAAG